LPRRSTPLATRAGPSAKELARRVNRHYNQLHSLKAGYTESYEGLGLKRAESGTLLMLKPGRMKWEYSSPPGNSSCSTEIMLFYSPGDSQVQRHPCQGTGRPALPAALSAGHTELEKE